MKAATGELNMTVVIVLAIAILSAFFYTVIWPRISENQTAIINCRRAICGSNPNSDGMVQCEVRGPRGNVISRPMCTWKG